MSVVSPSCYPMDAMAHHPYGQISSHSVLPPPRSYYVVSWVPRALPEVVQLVKEIPMDAERCLINKHFELGMLVMRRCGVQNPEEIKCLLDGFREGTTRLSTKEHRHSHDDHGVKNDKSYGSSPCCSPTVERRKLLIFFNDHRASRPWVLCPAKHCIKSARTTGKVKGRVKIFQFDPRSTSVKLPKLFYNCLGDFMTRDQYVFATFCPQQKYTDHELEWFDLKQQQDRQEPGGDTIFRDLVEEHDTKGTRVWPFEDYIIFANSLSKIVAVFKKKQPLLTLYRHVTWPAFMDDTTVTTTASSMALGPFLGSVGSMMASVPSCMLASTTSLDPTTSHGATSTGGADFVKQGLDADEEQCTVVDVAAVARQADHQLHASQRRPVRACRQSFTSTNRATVGRDESTEETDADDDDSDFDLSGKRSDRTVMKSGRRCSRVRSTDGFNTPTSALPPPIASPAESPLNMQDNSPMAASPQISFEYQFGLGGGGMIPSLDLVRQAEEAEHLLVSIMTRVLNQLEPLDSAHVNTPPFASETATQAPTNSSMSIKSEAPTTVQNCSDRNVTASEYGSEAPGTTTTTAESSGMEGEDGQGSGFVADGSSSTQLHRRSAKLDFVSLGQEMDSKKRKVIHYPSPTNAVLYHQLVRQFLSRLAFGLDHPPLPQKRIPDTVKRVVTKIVADSIKEINLALLTSSIRQGDGTQEDGATPQGQLGVSNTMEASSYNQPFSSFGSQAPPGNGAIVMSSRAGLYSTYNDNVNSDNVSTSNHATTYMQNYSVVDNTNISGPTMCTTTGMTHSPVYTGALNHAAGLLHYDPNAMDPTTAATFAVMQSGAAANQYLLGGGMMNGDFSNTTSERQQQLLLQQRQLHQQYGVAPPITVGEVADEEDDIILKSEVSAKVDIVNMTEESTSSIRTTMLSNESADKGNEQDDPLESIASHETVSHTEEATEYLLSSPKRMQNTAKRRKRSKPSTPTNEFQMEGITGRITRKRKL